MRARRVRFTRPSVRETPKRVTKTRDGISVYRQNAQGRYARQEAIGEQRRRQSNICPNCSQWLEYADAKFASKEFREGVENAVIHKKCPSLPIGTFASITAD